MSIPINSKVQLKPRLKFIDMARSLAILLMIEGHFTGAALSSSYRNYQYPIFKVWHLIHGLTSPLFFTITGVIFTYLLTADKDVTFSKNPRVKKGIKRIFQLLFWGYFIQLSLWGIVKSIYFGTEFHWNWFYAFHVLQSIAFGISMLILIYGLHKWINWGKPQWYYLVAGILMFTAYSFMKNHINIDKKLIEDGFRVLPAYWPTGAPSFIQNMFYGQYSDFSFVRVSGYTILGGMIGCLIRAYQHRVKELWFGTSFIIAGLFISLFIRDILFQIDNFTERMGWTENGIIELTSTSLSRLGQVISLLGALILIDKFFNVRAKLFLKIGQNTFPIYVVHVIILYGGIFGFGLKPLVFDRDLSPYLAVAISTTAIIFFVIMIKYIEPLEDFYTKILRFLHLKSR